MNMLELVAVAEELVQKALDSRTTIVFTDGTINTTTSDSWQSNKPVWVVVERSTISLKNAIQGLLQAYEDSDGLSALPEGFAEWQKQNPCWGK